MVNRQCRQGKADNRRPDADGDAVGVAVGQGGGHGVVVFPEALSGHHTQQVACPLVQMQGAAEAGFDHTYGPNACSSRMLGDGESVSSPFPPPSTPSILRLSPKGASGRVPWRGLFPAMDCLGVSVRPRSPVLQPELLILRWRGKHAPLSKATADRFKFLRFQFHNDIHTARPVHLPVRRDSCAYEEVAFEHLGRLGRYDRVRDIHA